MLLQLLVGASTRQATSTYRGAWHYHIRMVKATQVQKCGSQYKQHFRALLVLNDAQLVIFESKP